MRILFILLLIILAFGLGKYLYDTALQEKSATPVNSELREIPVSPDDHSSQKQELPSITPVTPEVTREDKAETRPLDLSLPASSADHSETITSQSKQNLLPDMFKKKPKDRRVLVSGKPILKSAKDGERLPEIDGATVDIEVEMD